MDHDSWSLKLKAQVYCLAPLDVLLNPAVSRFGAYRLGFTSCIQRVEKRKIIEKHKLITFCF